MAKTTANVSQKRSKLKIGLVLLNIAVIAALATTSGLFFKKYQDLRNEQQLTVEQKNEKLLQEVGRVYELPKDEKPTIFTVSDEQKFKEEYKTLSMAQRDDVLLVYKDASLAVLYRPSEKKVLATPSIKIPLGIQLIGSETATANAEKTLLERVAEDAKVIAKTSVESAVGTTVVVDMSGKRDAAAQQLAELFGGTVGQLPADQKAAEGADIVILVADPQPQP